MAAALLKPCCHIPAFILTIMPGGSILLILTLYWMVMMVVWVFQEIGDRHGILMKSCLSASFTILMWIMKFRIMLWEACRITAAGTGRLTVGSAAASATITGTM